MTPVYEADCLKCGSSLTKLRYCNLAPGYRLVRTETLTPHPDDTCEGADPEHFHRNCETCGYRWVTRDVLAPQDAIPAPTRELRHLSISEIHWTCHACAVRRRGGPADAGPIFDAMKQHARDCVHGRVGS